MKLTFVIPAYNEEKNIGKCLQSIINDNPDHKFDVEIIVVNNASADRTREVASGFSDVKIVDEQRKGITWARQAGFAAATGDLIANVDADNFLPAGWIKKVFSEFEKEQSLVGLSGPYIYYDLSLLTRVFVKVFYGFGFLTYLINHYIFKKGAMMQGGNYIAKKSALEKIGGFDTNISFYGEDTDIARRLQTVGKVKFTFSLPMYSSGRRLAEEGVMKTGLRYALNYLWILIFKKPFTDKYTDIRL